jgi:hypothetical protein
MLLRNVPVNLVASHHDTSAEIIERHYGRYITSVGDYLTRETLPVFATAITSKVLRLRAG